MIGPFGYSDSSEDDEVYVVDGVSYGYGGGTGGKLNTEFILIKMLGDYTTKMNLVC